VISNGGSKTADGIGTPLELIDLTADFDSSLGRTQSKVTVSNIRGTVSLTSGATPSTAGGVWAAGIAWVPNSITTGGLPDPLSEDYDWMWHNIGVAVQGTAQGDYIYGSGTEPIILNNRSMRKQPDQFSKLLLIVSCATGQNVSVNAALRTLYLLP